MSLHFNRKQRRFQSQKRHIQRVHAAAAWACELLEQRRLLDGVVHGTKYEDVNGNGVIDASDPPMPGVTIYADLNNNGVRDFTDPSTVTDAAGAYSLLLPGNAATLREEVPAGYDVIQPAGGSVIVSLSPTGGTTVNWLNRRRLDWGDAPDPAAAVLYPTLAAHNGARAQVIPGYSLGAKIDAEADGQPNATATGDDLATTDDEDGVTFLTPLLGGSPASVQVDFTSTAGMTGVLDAWIDFNGNGSWADPGERIVTNFVLAPGANTLSFPVPPTAVAGNTFARFRLSPNGVQTYDGTGFISPGPTFPVAGEVEDYQIRIESGQQLDWGDAPDTASAPGYPTLAIHNGARSEILPGFFLGGKIDAEPDGQPNATATGDDLSGSADEDGVAFSTLTVGAPASANVFLTAPVGSTGILDAWIDWNRDGDWADPGEQIATNVVLNPGNNVVNFTVPNTANAGPTYARFRLAQTAADVASYDGFGGKGEVEDYNPRIVPAQTGELDWGDAPTIPGTILQYPTLATQNGARHTINSGFHLGQLIDPEPDGQPTINADGDDTNTSDDEDGVTFLDPLIPGQPARIQVVLFSSSGIQGRLDAWIDWGADGTWTQPTDRIANSFVLNPGVNILTVTVPATAATGRTYSRFRLSHNGGLSYDGFGGEGEVEDYPATLRNRQNRKLDWGDAPDAAPLGAGYPTLASSNGARHTLKPGFMLGFGVDAENDGQPNSTATGDDINGGPNDEDGVTFLTPVSPGGIAKIQVVAPAGGMLDAWIDFGADFSWAQPGDRIETAFPLVPGINTLSVPVPAAAKTGQTYARFRLSTNGVASYDGYGGDGEVEDYQIKIESHGIYDFGDAPTSYHTILADNGARNSINPNFMLGSRIDAEPDGQPSAGASRDDTTGIDDEDGVTLVGGSMTAGGLAQFNVVASAPGILDAWVDLNLNGSFADPGEHVFAAVPVVAGNNTLSFTVPVTTPAGDTYARFRLGHTATPSYDGFGGEGETEDYKYSVFKQTSGDLDFGDAPAPYPTLLASNGARHTFLPGFTLGNRWDSEPNGQPQPQAMGDDLAGISDEDGVQFLSPLVRGGTAQIKVIAPAGGMLDAWIDFNGNGSWGDPGEQIATSFALVPGTNVLTIAVPAGPPAPIRTFSRFRLSTTGGLSFVGAGGNGEVEDYMNVINGPTVVQDPATGIVHIAGTGSDDHLSLGYDPQSQMLTITDLDTGQAPNWLFPEDDVTAWDVQLGGGNDLLVLQGLPQPTMPMQNTIGGSTGNDIVQIDGSQQSFDTEMIIQGNSFTMGLWQWQTSEIENEGFITGAGNDRFLLPAVQAGNTGIGMLSLNSGPGSDNLNVYDSFFDVFAEVSFDGGTQPANGMGDYLNLFGDGSASSSARYAPGAVNGTGDLFVHAPTKGTIERLAFSDLEPVNVSSFASFEVDLPAGGTGNDQISVDPVSLITGDANTISGTSNGVGFEQATISDVGAFTLNTAGNDLPTVGGSTDVVNFNGSIAGAGTLTMPAGLAGLTLNFTAGSIPIGWDPGSLGAAVTVNVSGGAAVHFAATQHLSQLNIASGGFAAMDANGSRVLVTKSLTMPPSSGQLDLTNNAMIVNYTGPTTPVGTIQSLLYSGRNGGTWNGTGIMTSSAPLLAGSALGYFDNTIAPVLTSFLGESVDSTSVLIRYTLVGDANLDQKVDIRDLYNLAVNYQQANRGWGGGDFNYDGGTNASDLGLLSSKWQQSVPPPGPSQPVGLPTAPKRSATRVVSLVE